MRPRHAAGFERKDWRHRTGAGFGRPGNQPARLADFHRRDRGWSSVCCGEAPLAEGNRLAERVSITSALVRVAHQRW
jgi:hypothetical protein